MRKNLLLLILGLIVGCFYAHEAKASPAKLFPGSYVLAVKITRGELAGNAVAGTCSVTASALSYSLQLPKGFTPPRISGSATHKGKSSFVAKSNVGDVRVTVTKGNSKTATGVFSHAQGSGTWSLTRR